jgi:hypothetical protein
LLLFLSLPLTLSPWRQSARWYAVDKPIGPPPIINVSTVFYQRETAFGFEE